MSSRVRPGPRVRAIALLLAALAWSLSGCVDHPVPTEAPSAADVATPTSTLTSTATPSPSPAPSATARPTPTLAPTPSPELDGPALAGVEHCPGTSAAPRSGPTHNNVSTNWSGYAVTSADPVITCIEAEWTQPKVRCRKARSSFSMWVGLGGFGQTRLVQVGTAIDCINGASIDYAWHESLPAERGEVDAPISVEPGDRIWAQVRWLSGSRYQLSIADITHPDGFTVKSTNRGLQRDEAEWIAEAPTGGCPSNCHILPMPSFGSVKFEKLSLTIGGAETGLLSRKFTRYRITMITQSYVTRAVVTGTATDGRSFTVGFKHA